MLLKKGRRRLHTQGGSQVGFASARTANEHQILRGRTHLASLLVGQLLVATDFTYLLPEEKEAILKAAGLFF